MSHRKALVALTLILYAVAICVTVWSLVAARRAVLASFGSAAEQAHWQEFRAEMDDRHVRREALREEIARESGQPITPQPPKSRSPRPPALELLTNHFAASISVALLAVSGLFAVIWGMIVGVILRPGRTIAEHDDD